MTCFIFWTTKNKRKHHLIVEYCKDFGLKRLQRGAFLGKLEEKERKFLEEKLRKYLTGARDNFYIISLCKDCWRKKISKSYEPESRILQPKKPFEIIE